MSRRAWLWCGAASALACLLAPPFLRALARSAPGGGVLILSIDCMRPDHMSCYGYARPTTPALDSIAADGIRFERCFAQANWTKPSIASLMSGLYVRHHGVTVGYRVVDDGAAQPGGTRRIDMRAESFPMPSDFPVLAEVFRAAGYRTGAFVENHQIDARQGFGRGFEVLEKSRTAAQSLWSWLEGLPPHEPVFAFVHLMGPHDPYDSARPGFAPYRSKFAGAFRSKRDFTKLAYKNDPTLTEADVKRATGLYDAELAYFDGEHVAPLLERLRHSGRYDRLLILVIADHGEELHEHGGWGHGTTLYEELARVPMVVKLPRGARGLAAHAVVDEPMELIDVFPTLCDLCSLPMPAGLDGQNVAPLLRGDRPPDPEALAICEYANFVPGRVLGAAIVHGHTKLIESYQFAPPPAPLALGDDREALFDLARDPGERDDLGAGQPGLVRFLRARLRERLGGDPATRRAITRPVPLPDSVRRELDALGYADDGD